MTEASYAPSEVQARPRRSFLGALLVVGTAAMGAVLALPLVRYVLYPLRNTTTQKDWSDLGPAANFANLTAPVDRTITVEELDGWRKIVSQRPVYVTKNANGLLTVLSPVCPHLGCTVRYIEAKKQFVCPCHNGVFTAEGKLISGPPPRNMDTLESKVEGGVLKVRYQFFRPLIPQKEVIG